MALPSLRSFGAGLPNVSRQRSYDTTTTRGLLQLANDSGLGQQSKRVLKEQGENPKKIFSGGFISDIFDVLNAIQYGVVGLIKGKGFMEGVKSRESFSDKDALGDFGLPGVIAGIALDILVDPLTYIAPLTILKKVPALAKVAKVGSAAIKASKTGQWFGRKLIWKFGADPVYKLMDIRRTSAIGKGIQNVREVFAPFAKMSSKAQRNLVTRDASGAIIRKSLKLLKKELDPKTFDEVNAIWKATDDLGETASKLGIFPQKVWKENQGEWIRNAYREFEVPTGIKGAFARARKGIKGVKKRKVLTLARREELGQITEAGYPLLKGALDLVNDIENAKFFKFVNKNFASKTGGIGLKRFVSGVGKFKSVDEFIISHQKVFRGGEAFDVAKMGDRGLPVTTNIKVAERFLKAKKDFRKGLPFLKLKKVGLEEFFISPSAKIAKKGDIPDELFRKYKATNPARNPEKGEAMLGRWAKEKGFDAIDYRTLGKISAKEAEIKILNSDILKTKQQLLDIFKKGTEVTEKLKLLPAGKRLGELAGKFVPQNIFDDVQELVRVRSGAEKITRKIVAVFKINKVLLNPATHVRNSISNTILNWWKLGIGPWRIDKYIEAGKELATNGAYWRRAKAVGAGLDNMAAREITDILFGPEGMAAGRKFGSIWKTVVNKVGGIYQAEENLAKLTAFIHFVKKGVADEGAWRLAEKATFNYSQVTPFVRRLRESIWGFPFITFSLKAAPIAVETALKHPIRISAIGKIKLAIENQSDAQELARERASEPAWIRDGFYIKLPMKDKHGRSAYFDLTYIIPFGDLASGQFFDRKRKQGVPEGIPEAMLSKTPLFQLIKELSRNEDFVGNRIWKTSDPQEQQLGDIFRHLTKTYMPPIISDLIPGGYGADGERRPGTIGRVTGADKTNLNRTLTQEMLKTVGIKIQPISADMQESYLDWNTRKQLETLLVDNGVLKEYNRTYVPKK